MSYPYQVEKVRYACWRNMMNRCYDPSNPDYSSYGGRGITVCSEWHNRKSFYGYISDKPEGTTLDRINNDSNYSPENCKWSTPKEQSLNRRSNSLITFRGETKPITVWADDLGIKRTTLIMRLTKYNWTKERALCTQ